MDQDLLTFAVAAVIFVISWLLARWWVRRSVRQTPSMEEISPWVESLASQLPETMLNTAEIDKDLRRAGRYGAYAKQRLFALRNGLAIASILLAGLIVVYLGPDRNREVLWTIGIGLLLAIVGFTVPRVLLALEANQRVGRIRDALPDALDTIGMCLHGGISFQECLGYVGRELMPVHPDLALELLMVGQHTEVNSFDFALQQFAARIDAPEIVSLATLITQNQRLGTGIIDSIRDFADNLRLKRRQAAEAKAGRAELFLLFPVIFCLLPSILLILFGPPILSLIDFLTGPSSPLRIAR